MAHESLAELVEEVRKAAEGMVEGDARTNARIDEIQKSLNALYVKVQRPGAERSANDTDLIRKEAADFCILRRNVTVPKSDGSNVIYMPSPAEIDDAMLARTALRNLWRLGDPNRLQGDQRKSLSSFSFGTNEFLLPPQLASQVLSCIVDPSDITSVTNVVNISGPSIKFLIDNQRMSVASWACESTCFSNNPQPDLQAGLGELEIKPESIRFTVCATNDLLADSGFNIESWLLRKVSDAVKVTINNAIVAGDGLGRPMGFLNPQAGIPIMDTSPSTPPGQIDWRDLVQLKWDLPMQWHSGGAYFMNQRTWALLATTTDAIGRPLFAPSPVQNQVGFQLNGSPVHIVTQFPDCLAGNTPVMFADLKQLYITVIRQNTTLQTDPYTADGWCTLFKFSARIGGGIGCPSAGRLLRVH